MLVGCARDCGVQELRVRIALETRHRKQCDRLNEQKMLRKENVRDSLKCRRRQEPQELVKACGSAVVFGSVCVKQEF